ncbi:MAG: hypothetical protein QM621_04410 [Aeromicrobium sp.]|uniref:hypothetical protein n=1 Tax=Aeromicrobium sp. TaxID=1871063 RepID=UPI0039E3ADFF
MRLLRATALPTLLLTLLASCGGSDSGSGDSGNDNASDGGVSCGEVTTGGWELFTEPRLTYTPDEEVVSLAEEGDVLEFTDAEYTPDTTYTYEWAYVDDGQAFTNGGSPFFDSEGGVFRVEGPLAPMGVDGGPYAGVVSVTATDSAGSTHLGNVCVELAE